MTKINVDLTERKPGLGSIPGPRKHKFQATLQEAIEEAQERIRLAKEPFVIYYSERRHKTCRYRVAPAWKAHWRGEHAVWISDNVIPGNG